jgi:arylsulfatase A-like enzyme
VIVDEAKKFIRENKDKPFFCYLPVTPPHGMFDIPESDPSWKLYQDRPWSKDAKSYAAMINMVDRHVGEVLALLKELGLDEKTVILLTGDNGGLDYFADDQHPRGFHAPNVNPRTSVEFRGHKGNIYEGGLRVPMIFRWPNRIAAGRVSDFLCYFPDVFPTFTELAGAPTPTDLDGLSIVPELLGEAATGRKQQAHEYLYWEFLAQTAVRMGTWKAIQPAKEAPWELYDLAADISEQHDLAKQQADVLAKMQGFAQQAHEEVREGEFKALVQHERDRQAKWGDTPPEEPVKNKGKKGKKK